MERVAGFLQGQRRTGDRKRSQRADSDQVIIDLEDQTISSPQGTNLKFEIDPTRKENLLKGLDDISLALSFDDKIKEFEEKQSKSQPWLWA